MAKNKIPPPVDSAQSTPVASPAGIVPEGTMHVIYAQIAQQHISGPIPSPEVLRQYDALSPGLADRLFRIAEQEADHRRKVELELVAIQGRDQQSYRKSEFWGQVFGFLIGVIAIAGAVLSAVHGAQIAGAFIGTTGVVGLVSAFIAGRSYLMKQKKLDFEQAMQANPNRAESTQPEK